MYNDYFLLQLVIAANNFGLEKNITIFSGGFLISGVLIGNKAYENWLVGCFSQDLENVTNTHCYKHLMKNANAIVHNESRSPKFLHIKNAVCRGELKAITYSSNIWWRGKISDVSGFTLGKITVNKSS